MAHGTVFHFLLKSECLKVLYFSWGIWFSSLMWRKRGHAVLWCSMNEVKCGPLGKGNSEAAGIIDAQYMTPNPTNFQPMIIRLLGTIRPDQKVFSNKIIRSPNFNTCFPCVFPYLLKFSNLKYVLTSRISHLLPRRFLAKLLSVDPEIGSLPFKLPKKYLSKQKQQ